MSWRGRSQIALHPLYAFTTPTTVFSYAHTAKQLALTSPTCGHAAERFRTSHSRRLTTGCSAESGRNINSMAVEARTMAWARVLVCGLTLCPFAEQVLDSNTVRLTVSDAEDEQVVKEAFATEVAVLLRTSPLEVSTTLLVMPQFAQKDFLRFHALCGELENLIESSESLVDDVMLACFHPQHRWGDSDTPDDAINFDKRAPYPIINFLRAPQVDRYVEEGKTQRILERNQATLERIGAERLKELYRSLSADTSL